MGPSARYPSSPVLTCRFADVCHASESPFPPKGQKASGSVTVTTYLGVALGRGSSSKAFDSDGRVTQPVMHAARHRKGSVPYGCHQCS